MDSQLTITEHLVPIDDIDHFLANDILMIVQNTQILELVKIWNHQHYNVDKAEEKFFEKIMLCVTALFKANAHLRNYRRVEEIYLKKIEIDDDNKKTFVDILYNKTDVFVEIEGFLTQVKTALDLLAQSFKHVYQIDSKTWHKKKDSKTGLEVSGLAIVNSLQNLGTDIKPHVEPVISLIIANGEKITSLVNNRDGCVHYGKVNNIQGFRYSVSDKKVYAPIIAIDSSNALYVKDYLENQLEYIAKFIQEILVLILSNLVTDMVVRKNTKGEWGLYTNNINIK